MTDDQVLLRDDSAPGFDLADTWALLRWGSFTADDGIVTTSSGGLRVAASGTNPSTAEPASTVGGTEPNGSLDHTRWMADTRHMSSNSSPGFDAVPGQVLSCSMWARGHTFGTDTHPFGGAVNDPQSDLRLGSFAMNTIDVETATVFDVWVTNTGIYPYYERLNLPGASYQAFSSFFPGVPPVAGGDNLVTVAYDRSAGVVDWIVNGSVAATVDKIGFPSPQATLTIDRGGTPHLAAPRQINGGMALLTLMDGGLPPAGDGLVRLGGSNQYPKRLVGGSTVFGQGVEMEVKRFEVRTRQTGP